MTEQEIVILYECKAKLTALIGVVSAILGSAEKLEDAADALQIEIDRAENPCPPHCKCNTCVAARSDEHYDRKGWESVLSRLA